MTENPFQIFIELGNRWPVLSEAYFYAIGAPAVIILFFFGRFWLRSIVNKRVRSISFDGDAFLSLDQMRKKGLITDEEYKTARRKAAEKQLASMTAEPAGGKNPFEVLMAIEANPELAKSLIQPVDERVRKSLEGLGRKHTDAPAPPPMETSQAAPPGAPRPAPLPIEAWDEFVAGDPLSSPPATSGAGAGGVKPAQAAPPPAKSLVSAPKPVETWEAFLASNPLAEPSPVAAGPGGFAVSSPAPEMKPRAAAPAPHPAGSHGQAPPPSRRAKSGGGSIDLDALLEKGLISPEEHAKLSRLGERL